MNDRTYYYVFHLHLSLTSAMWCHLLNLDLLYSIVLQVSAEDKGTGSKEQITINNDQNRLSPEDIERMINDAEKYSDDDKKVCIIILC